MSKAINPTCYSHINGVADWLKGKNWRVPNCRECDAKVARGEVTADAPMPCDVRKAVLAAKREKGQRPEAHARRKAARAAMVKAFHETPPGKESARAGS